MINPYWELVILLGLINVIFALTLNLILGYNGQFSLGHAGFIAVGAYTSGVVTATLHWPLWAGILLSVVFSAAAAGLIGYPCLRLRGDYLAIATLGFSEIIRIVLLALPKDKFGGPTGMSNVPVFKDYIPLLPAVNGPANLVFTVLFALLFLLLCLWAAWTLARFLTRGLERRTRLRHSHWILLAAGAGLCVWRAKAIATWFLSTFEFGESFQRQSQGSKQWALFLLFLLAVGAITWLIRNYLKSIPGRSAIAIREDEIAATNLGINCTWMKLQNFMLACGIAGFAGAMYAHTQTLFKPTDFNFFKSVDVLLMVVLGGMGSLTGSFVGAISITFLLEVLRIIGRWRMVFYSLLLILLMLFRPGGLMGTAELGNLLWRRAGRMFTKPGGHSPDAPEGADA